jgi:hypothetical protein
MNSQMGVPMKIVYAILRFLHCIIATFLFVGWLWFPLITMLIVGASHPATLAMMYVGLLSMVLCILAFRRWPFLEPKLPRAEQIAPLFP